MKIMSRSFFGRKIVGLWEIDSNKDMSKQPTNPLSFASTSESSSDLFAPQEAPGIGNNEH